MERNYQPMLCVQKFVDISGEARLIIFTLYAQFSWLKVIFSICIINMMLVWYIFPTFPQLVPWHNHLISVLQLCTPSQFLLWNSNKNTSKITYVLTHICFKSVKPFLHFKGNIFRFPGKFQSQVFICIMHSYIHTKF